MFISLKTKVTTECPEILKFFSSSEIVLFKSESLVQGDPFNMLIFI